MAYSAEINRRQPALLMLMIDQSWSMQEPWAQTNRSKADALALSINRVLSNAVMLCNRGGDRIYHYFDVGVLGYGQGIQPVLHGATNDRPLVSVEQLGNNPQRVDQVARRVPDGAGGVITETINVPIWVDPIASGMTPMVAAFEEAERIVSRWCAEHRSSFPPIVINVTDGASTDGEPSAVAQRLKALGTDDGQALVFNLHLSGIESRAIEFPSSDEDLVDPNAAMLYRISSTLPASLLEAAAAMGYQVTGGSRGFLYNADVVMITDFLDIGTRSVTPTGLRQLAGGAEPNAVMPR